MRGSISCRMASKTTLNCASYFGQLASGARITAAEVSFLQHRDSPSAARQRRQVRFRHHDRLFDRSPRHFLVREDPANLFREM